MRKRLSVLVLVLLLVGSAYGLWRYVTVPNDLQLHRTSTGGFSGGGDGVDITVADGRLSQTATWKQKSPKTVTLTKEQQQSLVREIRAMKFFKLDKRYPEKPLCCDQFTTVISVTMDGKTHTVTYDDTLGNEAGDDFPQDVRQQLIDLDELLQSFIPGSN